MAGTGRVGMDMGVREVAGNGTGAGGRSGDIMAGPIDGNAAGAAGFQVHVPVDIDLFQPDPATAGNPGRDVAFRYEVVDGDTAGAGGGRFETGTGHPPDADGAGAADDPFAFGANDLTEADAAAAAATGGEIPAVDGAHADAAASGNAQRQIIAGAQASLVDQISASGDVEAFDIGGRNNHAEDQLGISSRLELEFQRPVLDLGQYLGGKLLGTFHAHFLLLGLLKIHIAGDSGRQSAEGADLAYFGKVNPIFGAVTDKSAAIDVDDTGHRHQTGGQEE